MNPEDVPVLIVVFKRPLKVRQLIAALATVAPKHVYLLADGPRPHVEGEAKLCEEARRIALDIPWECAVHTRFRDTNFGLVENFRDGISWFFSEVEAGIILEDDCIPDPSFFTFCAHLLTYYKDDERIVHISGNNFQDGQVRSDGSYYFSHYSHSWGWATWRRAWQRYDEAVANFPAYDQNGRINELPFSAAAKRYWLKHLRSGHSHWDGWWLYTTWYLKGLCIIPNQNLVSNIGFDSEATHTHTPTAQANVALKPLGTIVHPTERTVSVEADNYAFNAIFHVPMWRRITTKIRGIIAKLRRKIAL